MTHDELLDKIAQKGLEPYGNVMPTHLVLALTETVKLHKPDVEGAFPVCTTCQEIYPCGTIKAIKKELT